MEVIQKIEISLLHSLSVSLQRVKLVHLSLRELAAALTLSVSLASAAIRALVIVLSVLTAVWSVVWSIV